MWNNRWRIRATTSASNLRVPVVRRATVCRFAQCTGCENSRNAVHDIASRWVATRHVCYFVAAFLLSLQRIFLFPAILPLSASLLASPYYPKWYTSCADKPEYVDLTVSSDANGRGYRQDVPATLCHHFGILSFLSNFWKCCSNTNTQLRNYVILNLQENTLLLIQIL